MNGTHGPVILYLNVWAHHCTGHVHPMPHGVLVARIFVVVVLVVVVVIVVVSGSILSTAVGIGHRFHCSMAKTTQNTKHFFGVQHQLFLFIDGRMVVQSSTHVAVEITIGDRRNTVTGLVHGHVASVAI